MRADGTTWHGWIRFLLTVWWPGRARWHWHETLPRKVAMLLPRKVALLAFVRVYAVLGRVDPNYTEICAIWQRH